MDWSKRCSSSLRIGKTFEFTNTKVRKIYFLFFFFFLLSNKISISFFFLCFFSGIQGFVYRDSINMNVDKLFSFKIRKYSYMAKRYCLGLIHKNRLIILEALMHGEKLDMGPLTC